MRTRTKTNEHDRKYLTLADRRDEDCLNSIDLIDDRVGNWNFRHQVLMHLHCSKTRSDVGHLLFCSSSTMMMMMMVIDANQGMLIDLYRL